MPATWCRPRAKRAAATRGSRAAGHEEGKVQMSTPKIRKADSARALALAAGATVYEGEKACRRCGGHLRHVANGACVACQRADRMACRALAAPMPAPAAGVERRRRLLPPSIPATSQAAPTPAPAARGGVSPADATRRTLEALACLMNRERRPAGAGGPIIIAGVEIDEM